MHKILITSRTVYTSSHPGSLHSVVAEFDNQKAAIDACDIINKTKNSYFSQTAMLLFQPKE